jgi:hypothetical protein
MIPTLCEIAVCAIAVMAGALDAMQPPPIEKMPLSLTSYYFLDEDGEPVAWNYQANGDPGRYANMYPTSANHEWKVAACIQDWTKLWQGEFSWTTSVSFMWDSVEREVSCFDNFGAVGYRQPFFHEGYGEWVIPLDIMTDEPVHGLVWGWSSDMARIEAVD